MRKSIDARGLACPQPVILTRNAVNQGVQSMEVLVDNDAARINVSGYLEKNGFAIQVFTEEGHWRIEAQGASDQGIRSAVLNPVQDDFNPMDYTCSPQPRVVFIASRTLGQGSDELGGKLMQAFVFTLREMQNRPQTMILMNAGVTLAVRDSAVLEHLQALQDAGVEILVCGTCLDYFGLKDSLAVGRISNMYSIAEELLGGNVLRV